MVQMSDTDTAKMVPALEWLRSGLEPLKQLLAEERQASAEFNLFELLERHHREETHSRVLTWLLDPNGNHGVGDYFLKTFLLTTGCPLEVADNSDWTQVTSQREWGHEVDGTRGSLDILVVDASKQFLCAIENKVFHSESDGQLNRYRRALEESYQNFTRHYVFLTRAGMSPQSEDERAHWICANYTDILEILERSINECASEIRDDVRVFLQHYARILRKIMIPESTEIQQLARRIYLEHRDAVERVIKHKPNYFDDVKKRLQEAVAQQEGWTLVTQNDTPDLICFQPDVLEGFEVLKAGRWMPNHLLWFELGCIEKGDDTGKAWFQIELAPALNKGKVVREKIIETFRRRSDLLQYETEYDDGGMRWVAPDWLIKDADLGADWDTGIVHHRVNQFASNEFPSILEVIVNCLREYEAEQDQ